MSLQGKRAMVTGASRGIGRAVALELARAGADIAVLYAGRIDMAQETVDLCVAHGVRARAYCCDVSDYAVVGEIVGRITGELGGIEILINNAGITRDRLILRMSEDDYDAVVDVNLKGTFNAIRHVSAAMVKQRFGRIVNITSVAGLMGNAGQANYAAAKAGVVGLTKTVARELAGRNITCNAVAPGFIDTDMSAAISEAARQAALDAIPMKRMGDPADVARAVRFLVEAEYITGEVLKVDGGLYI